MDYGDKKHIKYLKDEYVKIFPKALDSEWKRLRKKLISLDRDLFKGVLPTSVSDVLIAEFPKLLWIYMKYTAFANTHIGNAIFECLDNAFRDLFKYTNKYQPKIAEFFMKEENGFDLHTCFYCDMAYVNVYKVGANDQNHFDLDHVLDKGKCPIVGLSLFNFVPSCLFLHVLYVMRN